MNWSEVKYCNQIEKFLRLFLSFRISFLIKKILLSSTSQKKLHNPPQCENFSWTVMARFTQAGRSDFKLGLRNGNDCPMGIKQASF